MKRYGVVMAGGGGTRFWPLSRAERPKQLLNLSGKDLMVNETLARLTGCIDKEDLFIVTNVTQAGLMEKETEGRIRKDHILAEPAARNTSACIGYAAMEIVKKYGDGIMVIVPSDHFIKDTEGFTQTLQAAIKSAEETDALITIGIEPTYAATGYGYIRADRESRQEIADGSRKAAYRVEEFVEKPSEEVAKEYLAAGNYYWNSGMFVWKASTILGYMERLLPDVYECLQKIGAAMGTAEEETVLNEVYPVIPKISVDYGIMERADHILVIPSSFGWNDIGSLDMLNLMKEPDENGNAAYGETLLLDTKDSIIYGTDKLIAAIGLKDMIVVQAKDAVLICPKDRAQEVKDVVETLKAKGRDSYL